MQICAQIGPILDKDDPPNVKGVASLLGAGKQSLLRKKGVKNVLLNRHYYATRKYGMPIANCLVSVIHNISRC